ncbi:MAG: hypothetical protein ACQESR_05815 [Planctomycetota bacterium]
MESCPTQAVLPLVGLAAEKVIRDRYIMMCRVGGLRLSLVGRGARFGASMARITLDLSLMSSMNDEQTVEAPMIWPITLLLALGGVAEAAENEGERPYEMMWANRTEDDHPPLVDFEDLEGWTVETTDAEASFRRSREQRIWGKYVGKLTYRGTGDQPVVRIRPPDPIAIHAAFDAVTCWIHGNNWAWRPDPTTPRVDVVIEFEDAEGNLFNVPLVNVRWKEWFLCHKRLTPGQIDSVKNGAKLRAIVVTGGHNKENRVIFFDNLAVFTERFAPLEFESRPRRGVEMFDGQSSGLNTGPGRLPFPTRPETILPENLTDDFTTHLETDGETYIFRYEGPDGTLIYRYAPETGTFDDLAVSWEGRGHPIQPCVGGGIYLAVDGKATRPDTAQHLGTNREGDVVLSRWRLTAGNKDVEATLRYRLWNKSLVIDVLAPGGGVAEVRWGRAVGVETPRLVTNPYYTYGRKTRPAVVVCGREDAALFLTGHIDWYRSNASLPWASNEITDEGVAYNGGTRYTPKTDGQRNDCFERFFLTVSPRYQEVLPTIANPTSPWKHITGTHVWRAHGAGNRASDIAHWRNVHRYGMRKVVITDHETGWRDGGESFTFRTRAAPGKGGDEGQYHYARVMQDELGFIYGPYNNYTDFAPVNQFWDVDMVSRRPDNQLQHAWARCYAPKPSRAVEYCARLAPKIEEKFQFSTAYCDVHTAVTPWSRTDYDPRVPGAGTFAAVYYAYGEIMLLQKQAWNGPVYSEGNNHAIYCGLTDGNYAQDQRYSPATEPWLVDFDLREMHDLCCNFGMGNPRMFFGRDYEYGETRKEKNASIDRFLAATVAFGHPGFLVSRTGFDKTLRSYYMLQQLQGHYTGASAEEIRYADADGNLLPTSRAVATGVYERSQIVTRYANGCVTVVNGNPRERMVVEAHGRKCDLPPNGYIGWTEDGAVDVISSDPAGHRSDYAVTPAYIYVDGRDRFMRFDKAAGNGIGICRVLDDGEYEVIPYQGAEVGFAIEADSAIALDKERKKIGEAELRTARGLTYVRPVEEAFSYLLTADEKSQALQLSCPRQVVVPGERVVVSGERQHEMRIPADAKRGERIWRQFEGKWIDFTVVPLAYVDLAIEGNNLVIELVSNLPDRRDVKVSVKGHRRVASLPPGKAKQVVIDLGPPRRETAEIMHIKLQSEKMTQVVETGLRTEMRVPRLVEMPEQWRGGMCVRGGEETFDFGDTRAHVSRSWYTCGGVNKSAIRMHPPWVGAVGYSFALYQPVTLPATPPAAFRALVGKGDNSDPGDGILYKVAVVDREGNETFVGKQTVTEHKWTKIEGDLSQFAGQTIRIKIIADVGPEDNSSGDWACWADMRIEAREPFLTRRLDPETATCRHEPGPFPVKDLTVKELRQAKRGWLRYDGQGLSGNQDPYNSFARLNGVKLGQMAPANGNEVEGQWAKNAGVPLSEKAIASLGARNHFVLDNPEEDCFKVRRFWIELELADGRRCSSRVSTATYTQPPDWRHGEGILVPFSKDIETDIWFEVSR